MALIKLSVLENFYVKYWKKVFQKIISVFRKICLSCRIIILSNGIYKDIFLRGSL